MNVTPEKSFELLSKYCEKENYKGWDPYDGLTSKFFRALPFIRNNRFCRLAWIQFFKKSPINFRPLTGVPKAYNAKGVGLFLTGYCNLYKADPQPAYREKIDFLANKIIALQSKGYAGSCWGYYFDWQARAFFQPKDTPTVVATSFVADALFHAFDITGNGLYKEVAVSSAAFVLKDLQRTTDGKGNICFSYSPLDQSQVFNASLLGARLLARTYHYTRDNSLRDMAHKAVAFVCDKQQTNGAWSYGTLPFHSWIDNFHTGFNLECIYDYRQYTGDTSFAGNMEKGWRYYIDTFFTAEGASKYYSNKLFPIDIHAPAQLLVTLAKLGRLEENRVLADKVLHKTIQDMQGPAGYFYYQQTKWMKIKIPYMRWSQSWMFYAMSYYLTAVNNKTA